MKVTAFKKRKNTSGWCLWLSHDLSIKLVSINFIRNESKYQNKSEAKKLLKKLKTSNYEM